MIVQHFLQKYLEGASHGVPLPSPPQPDLSRLQATGQEALRDMIAFMWKIVRGEASSDEIDAWVASARC